MKLPLNSSSLFAAALLVATFPVLAKAALWKTESELTARYGEPLEIRRFLGDRTFTYQSDDLKLEVQFLDGVSQKISYAHNNRTETFSPEQIEALLKANSEGRLWKQKDEKTWELWVPPARATFFAWETSSFSTDGKETRETAHRLDLETVVFEAKQTANQMTQLLWNSRSGAERRYQGVLEFKDEENHQRVAILRDGSTVLEVPWAWRNYPGRVKLDAGQTYEFTVRDEYQVDLDTPVAFVSDRVHKSHGDRVIDSGFFPLVRIKQAGQLIFDESVCEVHQTPMQRTTAEVGYGMYPATVCDEQFPHHSDWIRGGCMEGEEKTAPHYLCPKCVAACAKYKREHPEEAARQDW